MSNSSEFKSEVRIDAETGAFVEVVYGLRVDCALNGCPEPHDNDGEVLWRGGIRPRTKTVDGHAVSVLVRTITHTTWAETTAAEDGLHRSRSDAP